MFHYKKTKCIYYKQSTTKPCSTLCMVFVSSYTFCKHDGCHVVVIFVFFCRTEENRVLLCRCLLDCCVLWLEVCTFLPFFCMTSSRDLLSKQCRGYLQLSAALLWIQLYPFTQAVDKSMFVWVVQEGPVVYHITLSIKQWCITHFTPLVWQT